MRRFFKIVITFFVLEFGVFVIGTNAYEASVSSNSSILYADPPDDDIEPPDDPIINSPIPPDTVIFGPYGEPVIIVIY